MWGVVQPSLVVYSILPSRARYHVDDMIGQSPKAMVVSDRYASRGVGPPAQRGLQGHLLRDFARIAQRAGQAGRIGQRLLGLGYVMFRWRARGMTTADQFEPLQRRLRQALQAGADQASCKRTANTCAGAFRLTAPRARRAALSRNSACPRGGEVEYIRSQASVRGRWRSSRVLIEKVNRPLDAAGNSDLADRLCVAPIVVRAAPMANAQRLRVFRTRPSSARRGVRSRLSPDTNSPEDCLCLAKARASRPWRKAQP